MKDILDGLGKAYSFVRDNSGVLETLDGAKQIMDAVGEVCSVPCSTAYSDYNSLVDPPLRPGGGYYSYSPLQGLIVLVSGPY